MATLYQPLAAPESGWTRYNDNHPNLFYSTGFSYGTGYTGAEGSDYHYTSSPTDYVKFSFTGTRVRVLGRRYPSASYNYSATVELLVDGVVVAEYNQQGLDQYKTLFADVSGLANARHNAVIRVKSGGTGGINLDAIDIDSTGSLITQVPATTGVLRTTIESMNLGDYIACKYKAASGAIGKFSDLGGLPTNALHPDGSAVPDGFFYFIKAANGLLIADRVIQTNISWRTLQTANVIEGVSMASLSSDVVDIVPVMTGATTAGVTVTASHQLSAAYAAWKMFNNANGSDQLRWVAQTAAQTTPYWIKIDLGLAKVVKGYSLYNATQPTASPKDWTFEGSNTGAFSGEQVLLDTRNASAGNLQTTTYFDFPNEVAYRFYRLRATSNWGYTGYNAIEEMELYEKGVTGRIRSMTGGVSYVDGATGASTTEKSLGAFPLSNEWNTYLIDSSLGGNITPNSSNVWNHLVTPSWCRDTPVIDAIRVVDSLVAINSHRVVRVAKGFPGYPSGFSFTPETAVGATTGFRPVLEYR